LAKKIDEVIIIGCGIAGIAAARQLKKHKVPFRVISEDIGGRICTSKKGDINYGAYFVLTDYNYVLPLVDIKEKLHPFQLEFHSKNKGSYFLQSIMRHPLELAKMIILIQKFRYEYATFKKQSLKQSQKDLISSNPYFAELYNSTAEEFARKKGIVNISQKFLSEGVYMCSFLPLSKVSAFDYLRLSQGLFVDSFEFVFRFDKALKGIKRYIIKDSIKSIRQTKEICLTTKKGKKYYAKRLIMATNPTVANKLLGLKYTKKPSIAHVFHLKGKLKSEWEGGQFELFGPQSKTIFIRKERDNSFIFYTKLASPNFTKYFSQWKVIFHKKWDPAFNITGSCLVDQNYSSEIILAGDYNLYGLEACYISGLYAANRIISQYKKAK
tara:strand:+ start:374 stop:1519 length:1146 start_codon:yes stop_codon:yes gene_type:complete